MRPKDWWDRYDFRPMNPSEAADMDPMVKASYDAGRDYERRKVIQLLRAAESQERAGGTPMRAWVAGAINAGRHYELADAAVEAQERRG